MPHPQWSPDPSWPPPPTGWKLWVDDDDAPGPRASNPALSRVQRSSDDVEYFGDDRAWSEDSGPAPQLGPAATAPPARLTEVSPPELSVHHIGRRATVRWDDEHRYQTGTIVAVSADTTAINVTLEGLPTPVCFQREDVGSDHADPRLYVWM
ncbi:hypothetical protein [Mycobacterium sp.]|uniref:hypothetical protein n=1 Tax=Mycobacterium sp. TaxID=1785 RepID=UPI0031E32177